MKGSAPSTFDQAGQSDASRFETDEFLEFLKADSTGSVTLVLTRETEERKRNSLTHALPVTHIQNLPGLPWNSDSNNKRAPR